MKTLRSRYARRVLVPVIAVSLLSACTYWKVEETAPGQVVTEKRPERVRLTMLDGDKIQMGDPTISDGEVVGHPMRNAGGHYRAVRSDTLRVVTDSVARIEIREPDSGVTALLVTLGLVAVGLAIMAIICADGCGYGGG